MITRPVAAPAIAPKPAVVNVLASSASPASAPSPAPTTVDVVTMPTFSKNDLRFSFFSTTTTVGAGCGAGTDTLFTTVTGCGFGDKTPIADFAAEQPADAANTAQTRIEKCLIPSDECSARATRECASRG